VATANLPVGRSMVLEDIDWKTYTRLLRIFAERRSIRLTYDRGALEIVFRGAGISRGGESNMTTANLPSGDSMVLDDIDWKTYSRLVRAFAERPAIRLTYDRGILEIIRPSQGHEEVAYLLGRFVDTLTDELNWRVRVGRCTTFRKRRKQRGLEPDNSYWIASEPQVRGKVPIDLRKAPPPDLVIEVDITRSSLNRLAIYASLKVPEVWRFADDQLTFLLLQKDGTYAPGPSRSFPGLQAPDLVPFLDTWKREDVMTAVAQFRAWVRQRIADGWK
jgi:Uma2 family endonuclease